jgi:hypothetical protein
MRSPIRHRLLQLRPLRQWPKTILLPLLRPPLTPCLHPLPSFRIPPVDRRNHLLNPQSATKDRQLSERTMLRIRNSKTARAARATALRHKLTHAVVALPVVGVENSLYGRRLDKARVWRTVIPPAGSETYCTCEVREVVFEVII